MFGVWENIPYTNFHELNFDWIVAKVKEYITKTNKLETDFEFLEKDFEGLKEYVKTFFDSLDLYEEVSKKLDEMFDNGELAAIISRNIMDYAPLTGEYIGLPKFRQRTYYYETEEATGGVSKGFQNMARSGKYAYIFQTKTGNIDTELLTLDLDNNAIVDHFIVDDIGHGGSLAIKDNKMYSLSNGKLFTFDLTTPARPVLESSAISGIASNAQLVGAFGAGWLIKIDSVFYEAEANFTNLIEKYSIEYDGIVQDITIDPGNMLIYAILYQPNMIIIHDAITGEEFSTLEIPNVMNYISVLETEGISVDKNIITIATLGTTGAPNSTKIELNIFECDIKHKIEHKGIMNTASLRTIIVDYNHDPITFEYNANNIIVKYVEDAQNIANQVNNALIKFETDYLESMGLSASVSYDFNNKEVGAIKVNENTKCRIFNWNKTRAPFVKFATVPGAAALMYIGYGAEVQFDTIPIHTTPTTDTLRFWAYRATVKIENPGKDPDATLRALTQFYLNESILQFSGNIANYAKINKSLVICNAVLLAADFDIRISEDSTMRCRIQRAGATERFNLNTLTQVTYPAQCFVLPFENTNNAYMLINKIPIYKEADGEAVVNVRAIKNTNEWDTFAITINRETMMDAIYNFKYVVFTITADALPSMLCVAEFN